VIFIVLATGSKVRTSNGQSFRGEKKKKNRTLHTITTKRRKRKIAGVRKRDIAKWEKDWKTAFRRIPRYNLGEKGLHADKFLKPSDKRGSLEFSGYKENT